CLGDQTYVRNTVVAFDGTGVQLRESDMQVCLLQPTTPVLSVD
ncbi:MAG: hypothetical protein RLZZ369_1985, partial [Pseudomonadota bacterium]